MTTSSLIAQYLFLVSDDKHLRLLKKKKPPLVDLKTLQEYHEYLNSKNHKRKR